MALVPRDADWGYVSKGGSDGLKYYIGAAFKEQFVHASGYVMVLKAEGFEKIVPPIPAGWMYELPIGDRQPEMRSKEAEIRPLHAIKFTYTDFEALVKVQGESHIEYR